MASGEIFLTPKIDPADVSRFARSAEHKAMLEALGPRSYLSVPMSSRGQVLGALSLVYSDSGRVYGSAEVVAAMPRSFPLRQRPALTPSPPLPTSRARGKLRDPEGLVVRFPPDFAGGGNTGFEPTRRRR